MNSLRENKAFQTIVGGLVLYIAWVAWRDGWFTREDTEGFGSPELIVAVTSALLSFVQLVGILTIGIVSGLLPQLEELFKWGKSGAIAGIEYIKGLSAKWKDTPKEEGKWNWKPLAAVVLAWFVWSGGHLATVWDAVISVVPNVIEVLPEKKPTAVIFLLDESVTAEQNLVTVSQKVDELFLGQQIERRRLLVDQDLGSSEEWVRNAVQASSTKRTGPAMLCVYRDGTVRVKEIPGTVNEMEAIINAWST